MTLDIFIQKVLPTLFELMLYISFGVVVGVLLEATGVLKTLSKVARPILSLGNFSSDSAAAFVAAFGSAKTAHILLASAYRAERISRRELVLSATANTFPTALMHLKFFAPLMISVLGNVGIAYVSFVIGIAFLVFIISIVLSRLLLSPCQEALSDINEPKLKGLRAVGEVFWNRWWKMTVRIISVALPVYTFIIWFQVSGGFKWLQTHLPNSISSVLPVECLSIIIAQFSGTTAAVSVTKGFLESNTLTGIQVFFTLVTGYAFTLPLKVLRRNLPSALSIFPDTTGFYIIGLSQGIRFFTALCFVISYFIFV